MDKVKQHEDRQWEGKMGRDRNNRIINNTEETAVERSTSPYLTLTEVKAPIKTLR